MHSLNDKDSKVTSMENAMNEYEAELYEKDKTIAELQLRNKDLEKRCESYVIMYSRRLATLEIDVANLRTKNEILSNPNSPADF